MGELLEYLDFMALADTGDDVANLIANGLTYGNKGYKAKNQKKNSKRKIKRKCFLECSCPLNRKNLFSRTMPLSFFICV